MPRLPLRPRLPLDAGLPLPLLTSGRASAAVAIGARERTNGPTNPGRGARTMASELPVGEVEA
jgi:hypothetical protein